MAGASFCSQHGPKSHRRAAAPTSARERFEVWARRPTPHASLRAEGTGRKPDRLREKNGFVLATVGGAIGLLFLMVVVIAVLDPKDEAPPMSDRAYCEAVYDHGGRFDEAPNLAAGQTDLNDTHAKWMANNCMPRVRELRADYADPADVYGG